MSRIIKPIGQGLLAGGALLFGLYFIGAYIKGNDALADALNPFVLKNYLALIPLAPGAVLLLLAGYIAALQRRYEQP